MVMRARGRPGYLRRQLTYENFKPKWEWKYEDDATRLLIYLPGFVMEQIRVMFTHVDDITRGIKVQGRRQLRGGRWSQFIETYEIPENCDANKISSNFEQGFLSIVMPKIVDFKKVYADKDESIETTDISSRTSTQEKADTSAMEQREEKDAEVVSPKKEKSQKGREDTSSITAPLVDTAEKIDEKRVGSASESTSENLDEKSQKGTDEVSPKTAALADSADRIDRNKMESGGESASGKSDEKPQEQGEASSKTASLVDSTEKMDRKMVGSESASEKADGKSEKGEDDASTKTTALVDTVEKIDVKTMVPDGESEAIEKEMPAEAEKPERSTEKSKEFSSALEAVGPNTEEKEKIIDKSAKSVNEEREKETIVGKSKDIKDGSASAASSEGSTEGKRLLLNIGTAVLVIMGVGGCISRSLAPNFFNF